MKGTDWSIFFVSNSENVIRIEKIFSILLRLNV